MWIENYVNDTYINICKYFHIKCWVKKKLGKLWFQNMPSE